jgi:hypothetical protein
MTMKDSDMMSCPIIGCKGHLTKNYMLKHLMAADTIVQITDELIRREEIEEQQQHK